MIAPNEFFAKFQSEMDRIVAQYEQRQAALLPILNLAQEHCGYISPEIEEWVGRYLNVPIVHVREVLSFYSLLYSRPMGKHNVQVCRTLSCQLRGSEDIVDYFKKKLGIKPGQTSSDGKVSLSTVECLGACEIAPMMQLNDEYVGPLTREKIDKVLGNLIGV